MCHSSTQWRLFVDDRGMYNSSSQKTASKPAAKLGQPPKLTFAVDTREQNADAGPL